MRPKFILLFVILILCLNAASAQKLIETESRATLQDSVVKFTLVIDNPGQNFAGKIELDIIDKSDALRAHTAQILNFRHGKSNYNIPVTVSSLLKTDAANFAWYRVRYRIGGETGTIALSELLKDIYELSLAASDNLLTGINYRVRVRAVHPFSKLAVKDVRVAAELILDLDTDEDEDELKLSATGKTAEDGSVALDFNIPPNIKLDYGSDLKITGFKNGIVNSLSKSLERGDQNGSLLLSADKPLYQPGQTFNVRALYFDANSTVVPDTELEFVIKDESNIVMYRETVRTSSFGIASISWKIPDNVKLGAYRVEIETEEDVRDDQLYFKISRYDLPQFTVKAVADRKFYLPGQNVAEITVSADYLFGKPVTAGRARVVQESERYWSWSKQKYEFEEKRSFEGAVDAQGKYVIKIDLSKEQKELSDSSSRRFEDIGFSAYFTDQTTNRTEQQRFDVRLSKEAIHVYLLGQNRSNRNPALPFNAYVTTYTADGEPVSCDVNISGARRSLANYTTNSMGAARVEFRSPFAAGEKEEYELKITARDKAGATGTFTEDIWVDNTDQLQIALEKAVIKPGEALKVSLLSTKKDALVYVDMVQKWSAIDSYLVRLKNGQGELRIPYQPAFKGDLTLAAYIDGEDNNKNISTSQGVVYPAQQNLKLEATLSAATLRPNEEAKVSFAVLNGVGRPVESALGMVVLDKAIEERARTDASFGSYYSRFAGMLGYSDSFGGISLKDLNDLDLTKPVSPETQLAAEIMLLDRYFYPRFSRTDDYASSARAVYSSYFTAQLDPVKKALNTRYAKDYAHPTDDASLRQILMDAGIDFNKLRDPWGENYRGVFEVNKDKNVLRIVSTGTDKKFGTPDDFIADSSEFEYFPPTAKIFDTAVKEYMKKHGGFIRDVPTLSAALAEQGFDYSKLKDHWGRDYRVLFESAGRKYIIRLHSDGANGEFEQNYWRDDDFDVWRNETDFFDGVDIRISQILARAKTPPKTENEFSALLAAEGMDIAQLMDGNGGPLYVTVETSSRLTGKLTVENVIKYGERQNVSSSRIDPVRQEIAIFVLRSIGPDKIRNSWDDVNLSGYISVLSETPLSDRSFIKTKVPAFSGVAGAIRGIVVDANGAVIPNATLTLTNEENGTVFTAASNSDGEYLFQGIPPGKYQMRVESPGFQVTVYTSVLIKERVLIDIDVQMNAGSVQEVVTVTSSGGSLINTTQSTVGTNITARQLTELPINGRRMSNLRIVTKSGVYADDTETPEKNSTPRLRAYFPETLLWMPELLTDKNGRAEMKFRLADNITTWKLYTIASTKNGKVGVVEKEITAFQPFFVDLEPPKFLTTEDEISLPVTVRNYTEKKQSVAVTMAKSEWFSFLGADSQQINVDPDNSQNAVFGFKATTAVKDGKQKVTAIAQKESDAIEKPVTVRPNGKEIVKTESKVFRAAVDFNVDFPANALPGSNTAEVKLYPNLLTHVGESVEGLLRRPYGCGEQTISSTYPNLMILKFAKAGNKLHSTARKYLQKGYERLLGYQVENGGFSYWGGKDSADVALTAYALRFLSDAGGTIDVDEEVVKRARAWLVSQQSADGSWNKKHYGETQEDQKRVRAFTAYIARILSASKEKDAAFSKAIGYLKLHSNEITDPYSLAQFGLALADSGDTAAAGEIAARLEKMAIAEDSGSFWKMDGSTPFNGWGTTARIETTALVIQLLAKVKTVPSSENDLLSRATVFLLKNKDRYGVWYSTQTTINVLDTFLLLFKSEASAPAPVEPVQIYINGAKAHEAVISSDQLEPVVIDLADKLAPGPNRVEIKTAAHLPLMSQIVSTHYIDWKDAIADAQKANGSPRAALHFAYTCDKQNVEIMQQVNCTVELRRTAWNGYGMLLAEIGTPPGADVSRESLEKAKDENWMLSRYDVLPDRIIVYLWAWQQGAKFNFSFRPRYGINAQTPASIAYDYYNPEAQSVVTPLKFTVK